jgi:hypothetical protein
MDRRKPLSEGLQFLMTTVGTQKQIPKRELRLGAAESLSVLTSEYVFFTPAILYLNQIVNDDPLLDFQLEYGRVVPFYWVKVPQPFFRGLTTRDGDKDWNHALWAIDRIHWPAFEEFYSAIVVFNEPRHLMYRIGVQYFDVADYLALRGLGDSRPTLPVTAFGIDGNKVRVAFEVTPDPWNHPPMVRRYPPADDIVVYANALKAGVNPHFARDAFLKRIEKAATEKSCER